MGISKLLERIVRIRNNAIISVVSRHRFDASGSGPTFHFEAFDAYPDLDPTPSFTHVGK
jgi:hypothetical protein